MFRVSIRCEYLLYEHSRTDSLLWLAVVDKTKYKTQIKNKEQESSAHTQATNEVSRELAFNKQNVMLREKET